MPKSRAMGSPSLKKRVSSAVRSGFMSSVLDFFLLELAVLTERDSWLRSWSSAGVSDPAEQGLWN